MTLKEWIDYLESRVDIDVYVWGGNGETIITLLSKLCDMEKDGHTDKEALNNVGRTLTLLQKRLLREVSIIIIRGADCSGLGVYELLKMGIIKGDMTADSLYRYITEKGHGKKIKLSEVKAGDYLFKGSSSKKTHVGYAVSEKYAVESKNHDVGVVKTVISEGNWKYAARPNWYDDDPEPVKPVLKRELYYTNPMMKGDDVKEVQYKLNSLDYNCGIADGYFGNKTSIAVKNFQTDNNLKVDGVVGKKTAEKLGFKWEG